jgi:hypothetical protein
MSAVAADADEARPVYKAPPLGWRGVVELIIDVVVIGHIVKWAVDAFYYLAVQCGWGFYSGGRWHQWWYLKNVWDHLPAYVGHWLDYFGIEIPWLELASTQAGWVEPRHYARDTMIGLFAGLGARFLMAKAKRHGGKAYRWWQFAGLPLLAPIWAIPGLAIGTLAIVFVPGLVGSGLTIPSHGGLWGQLALDINQFIQSGSWQPILLGVLGAQLFAKKVSLGPADQAQWFFAGRKADKIRAARQAGNVRLRDRVILGTRAYRNRVNWLVEHNVDSPDHGPGVTRAMVGLAALIVLLATIGAYLTTIGPAAHA